MGIKKKLGRFFKTKKKREQEELRNRANQFMEEYKTIRLRYQCDFQAYLKMEDGGEGGILPNIRIIDITKTIEKEELAEKIKKEAIEKQKLEKNKIDKIEAPKPPKNAFGH